MLRKVSDMKGFKNSTKTMRMSDGGTPCYAKGGKVAGAKVGKVMHEYGQGKLHSGSKKGPVVKDQKQAVAIALSEGRKAAASKSNAPATKSMAVKPIKKADGGAIGAPAAASGVPAAQPMQQQAQPMQQQAQLGAQQQAQPMQQMYADAMGQQAYANAMGPQQFAAMNSQLSGQPMGDANIQPLQSGLMGGQPLPGMPTQSGMMQNAMTQLGGQPQTGMPTQSGMMAQLGGFPGGQSAGQLQPMGGQQPYMGGPLPGGQQQGMPTQSGFMQQAEANRIMGNLFPSGGQQQGMPTQSGMMAPMSQPAPRVPSWSPAPMTPQQAAQRNTAQMQQALLRAGSQGITGLQNYLAGMPKTGLSPEQAHFQQLAQMQLANQQRMVGPNRPNPARKIPAAPAPKPVPYTVTRTTPPGGYAKGGYAQGGLNDRNMQESTSSGPTGYTVQPTDPYERTPPPGPAPTPKSPPQSGKVYPGRAGDLAGGPINAGPAAPPPTPLSNQLKQKPRPAAPGYDASPLIKSMIDAFSNVGAHLGDYAPVVRRKGGMVGKGKKGC